MHLGLFQRAVGRPAATAGPMTQMIVMTMMTKMTMMTAAVIIVSPLQLDTLHYSVGFLHMFETNGSSFLSKSPATVLSVPFGSTTIEL